MKTLAIASIVGALILYVYLALAHTVLQFHDSDFKYTSQQESILNALSASNLEAGFYLVPTAPPGSSNSDQEKMMQDRIGKPGALVNYYPQVEGPGASMFIMSFIYNLIAVLILCVTLATANDKLNTFLQRLWFVMLFVFFVIFSQIMLEYNWVQLPMQYLKGSILDLIIGYLLVGLWLAWYYGRLSEMKRQRVS